MAIELFRNPINSILEATESKTTTTQKKEKIYFKKLYDFFIIIFMNNVY